MFDESENYDDCISRLHERMQRVSEGVPFEDFCLWLLGKRMALYWKMKKSGTIPAPIIRTQWRLVRKSLKQVLENGYE